MASLTRTTRTSNAANTVQLYVDPNNTNKEGAVVGLTLDDGSGSLWDGKLKSNAGVTIGAVEIAASQSVQMTGTRTTTPTTPTYTTVLAAVNYSTAVAPETTITLDLKGKKGAVVTCYFGRTVATALTRAARVLIRRTRNGSTTIGCPANSYDQVSSIAAVNATTLNGAVSAADTTATLTSGTGTWTQGIACLSNAGRIEFIGCKDVTTTTFRTDESGGFKVAHNNGDTICNGADVMTVWVPGGDIWDITPENNSGQTVVIGIEAEVHTSDTTV